jgi:hypothetical protein
LFEAIANFSAGERAVSWEISIAGAEGVESGEGGGPIMGNGERLEAGNSGFFPRPLTIIGVLHALMQSRAHDLPHRTALLQWLS